MRLLQRRLRRTITVAGAALLAAIGVAVAGGAGGVTAVAATSSCAAAYSVQTDWGSGFTAVLTVTNTGTSAITGWTVTYSYAGNQTLQSGWSGNWTQSGKAVTVTNASYNGSLAAGAAATGVGANFNYSGTNAAPTSVTCTPAGSTTPPPAGSITATPTSLSVTQGKTGTFTLALSQAPTSNETVSIAASGNAGLTESPTSLTFTPSNFATAQTVTVTANSSGTGATTFTASGSGYTSATVTATEVASTTTGSITATPTSLNVTQGKTGTFTLALSKAPTSNVTVSVAASGNAGLTASPTSLTFTPSNFATAQTVTVTANSTGTGTTTFTASGGGDTSATVTATEVAATTSGAAPQLQVSGNKLVNASGSTVVLHGVDRSGTEYSCVQGTGIFDGANDQASITAIKSWGPVNAVRVPLNEACWNAESYVTAADAGTNYINAIKSYVSLLNSNGIVAILDLHWTDGTYTGPSAGSCTSSNQAEAFCQKPMPDSAEAIPFWTSVASTFKGNDAVIFDLFNEPFASRADNNNTTEGWQCWETGSPCTGISYPVAGMQQMVNAVRGAGANNVIMLGGEEYANDLTDWLQFEPTDPDHDLAASFHSYNFNTCSNQSCWTSQVAPVAASVPVVAGEIGENDCAGGYITPLTTWMESDGISFLAWAWNADFACSSGPGLITDYTGTPTAYGAAYKSVLQALPAG
jgi:endoglucanase